MRLFGESIRARARGEEPPEGGYQGEYIGELAAEIDGAAERDPEELAVLGVEHMMERVKGSLERFRVHFDRFFSERSMYDDGSVERVLGRLGEHVYEHEGARWLRTSSLGDEKDSVLIRSSGRADVLRLGHRLPRGQARARLRPRHQHLGRRPPRPREADARVVAARSAARTARSSC